MEGIHQHSEYQAHDALPQLLGFVALVLALVIAWPALLVGLALCIVMGRSHRLGWALWGLSLACAMAWVRRAAVLQLQQVLPLHVMALWHLVASRHWSIPLLLPHLVPCWLNSLALTPLVAFAFTALSQLRGKQQQEEAIVLASGQRHAAEEQRRAAVAARRTRRAPSSLVRASAGAGAHPVMVVLHCVGGWQRGMAEARRQVVLGAAVSGDLAPAGSAWRTRRGPSGGWVAVPGSELRLPGVIIGASGSGKTETALRLAAETAGALGWQVIYLDAKGDYATAARFLAAMQVAGVPGERVAVFPARHYDGWRGDGTALLNRLLATQDSTEEYYQAVAKQLLYLTLTLPGAGEPPRCARELLQRLQLQALQDAYAHRPEAGRLAGIDPKQAHGVLARYDGFFTTLAGKLDGDWAYEDVDAAYLLLDGLALREDAASLGKYLVEDFAHYAAKRKDPRRQTLLIIDEYSALSLQTDAANLFERLRSYSASVFVTAQSYAGLGKGAARILDAANLLIVQRTNDPRRLIERAGMVQRIEAAHTLQDAVATGRRTVRGQDRLRVDPDVVRQLEVGEGILIAHGRSERICVAPLQVGAEMVAHADLQLQRDLAAMTHAAAAAWRTHDKLGRVDALPRPGDSHHALTEAPALGEERPVPALPVAAAGRACQVLVGKGRAPAAGARPIVPATAKRKRIRTKRPAAHAARAEEEREAQTTSSARAAATASGASRSGMDPAESDSQRERGEEDEPGRMRVD